MYQGIPSRFGPGTSEYDSGVAQVFTAGLIFLGLIFIEFFTLIFGVSLLFSKVNAVQIVLHFIGVLATIWQILNLNSYRTLWSLMAYFGALPLALEIGVIMLAFTRYHVID